MADNEDDVIVALEPDLFEGGKGAEGDKLETVVAKAAPDKAVTKVADKAPSQELLDQFKTQAQTEKTRREAAERSVATERQGREQASRERDAAREEVADRELDTINAGLDAAKTEADAASIEYQTAFDTGDAAKMAASQRKIARAEAKSVRLDEAKSDLEARKAARPEQRTDAARQEAPADPVERYVQGRTESTANWLRAHPDWITDQRKNAKLTSAHYAAVSEGLSPDTDEYFEHVETTIGLRQAEGDDVAKPERKPNGAFAKTRRTPPAAPTGGGANGGGGGAEVRLSAGEARAAQDGTVVWNVDDPSPQKRYKKGDPVGVQEFARRKHEMTKQGLYDRTYVES